MSGQNGGSYPMSVFAKFAGAVVALGMLMFAGAASACDNCGGGAYYRDGGAIYSCNQGSYDCRYESAYYRPRCDDSCGGGCNDGCHVYHRSCCHRSCDTCRDS